MLVNRQYYNILCTFIIIYQFITIQYGQYRSKNTLLIIIIMSRRNERYVFIIACHFLLLSKDQFIIILNNISFECDYFYFKYANKTIL